MVFQDPSLSFDAMESIGLLLSDDRILLRFTEHINAGVLNLLVFSTISVSRPIYHILNLTVAVSQSSLFVLYPATYDR